MSEKLEKTKEQQLSETTLGNNFNQMSVSNQTIESTPTSSTSSASAVVTFSSDTSEMNNEAKTSPTTTIKAVKGLTPLTMPDFKSYNWDPLSSNDWDLEKPTHTCLHRIKKDIYHLYQDPAPGILVVPDNDDITKIHALVTGPFDTPYEGGFFYFLFRCPPNYPFKPPRVRLMTTSNGTTRFNPNLYKNGKVCLSILGTWEGPAWLPSQSIASVLMSIQSLMNSNPYHNEPGFEKERQANASKNYNDIIKHETIRVAVCENLENENFEPKMLRNVMRSSFIEYYDYYIETCKANLHKDSEVMNDLLFHEIRGNFKYGELLKRLESIKEKLDALKPEDDDDDDGKGSDSKCSSLEEDDGKKI